MVSPELPDPLAGAIGCACCSNAFQMPPSLLLLSASLRTPERPTFFGLCSAFVVRPLLVLLLKFTLHRRDRLLLLRAGGKPLKSGRHSIACSSTGGRRKGGRKRRRLRLLRGCVDT